MAALNTRQGEIISGINVTPMVDVVLVLLIVLMVTASYTVSKSISVQLPKAATGESAAASPLAISIDRTGALFLDGEAQSREQLRQRVRVHSAKDVAASALISADGSTSHRAVVGVIDLLRAEGLTKFAINVAPEDLQP